MYVHLTGKINATSSGVFVPLPYKDFGPGKAIDGLYHYSDEGIGNLDSLVVTDVRQSPWIQLDLRESYCINSVKIWDRAEGVPAGRFQFI